MSLVRNVKCLIVDDDEDEDEWDTCSEDDNLNVETENEDDPISLSEDDEKDEKEKEKEKEGSKKKTNKNGLKSESKPNQVLKEQNKEPDPNVLTLLKDLQSKNKDDLLVTECIKMCEEKMKKTKENQEKIQKKIKERNDRIFRRILRDKNTLNDFEFFDADVG